MSSTLCFITGANQGIGKAAAEILASKHGFHVLIGARNLEAGEKVAAEIRAKGHKATAVEIDLQYSESIQKAVETLTRDYGYLDVLINNAGISHDHKIEEYGGTWNLYEATMRTNLIGPAALTDGLIPLLEKSKNKPARVIFMSSIMGSIEISTDTTTMWYPIEYTSYDVSKAGVNMLMVNYHRRLTGSGIKVNSLCPGYVKSNLTRFNEYGITVEEGASHVVTLATIGEDGPSGTFSNSKGKLPW